MEFFADKGAQGFAALVAEIRAEAKAQAVTEYWRQHYALEQDVCVLCEGNGHRHIPICAGDSFDEGNLIPCICPKGQAFRAFKEVG